MARNGFSLSKCNGNHDTNPVATWQETLRQVVYDGITSDDVKEIVQGLVKRAKEGDPQATRMVFEYVLGGRNGPQISNSNVVIQADTPPKSPTAPTAARPRTREKLDVMQQRMSNGEPLCHKDDA